MSGSRNRQAVDYVRAESVAHALAVLSDVDGDVTALPELARTFDDAVRQRAGRSRC